MTVNETSVVYKGQSTLVAFKIWVCAPTSFGLVVDNAIVRATGSKFK